MDKKNEPLQRWGLQPLPQNLPPQIRMGFWCAWKAERKPNGKVTKIPYSTFAGGGGVSTAKPDDWMSINEALSLYSNPKYSGIGKLILAEEGLIFFDLDGCVDIELIGTPEKPLIDAWAQGVVDSLASYTEISPSGTGLRIVVSGSSPGPDINNAKRGIEIYSGTTPRYVTMTGHILPDLNINGAPPITRGHPGAVAKFYELYKPAKKEVTNDGRPDLLDGEYLGRVFETYAEHMESRETGDRSHDLTVYSH